MRLQKLELKNSDTEVGDFFRVEVCGCNMRLLRYEFREVVEIPDGANNLCRKARVKNGTLIRTKNKVYYSSKGNPNAIRTVWREVK